MSADDAPATEICLETVDGKSSLLDGGCNENLHAGTGTGEWRA